MAWRDPPREIGQDTSDPDVVSLATLLANPLDPSVTVARGLAFGGTMGFIHGPKASGKTTILAAAAARVSRGQPWAGHDTEAGTVLVVCNDDPRSWVLALRDFGADPERILTARARVVSRPGKLAALLAEYLPAWVIIDNMRTWCGIDEPRRRFNRPARPTRLIPLRKRSGSVAIWPPAPSSTTRRIQGGHVRALRGPDAELAPCSRMRRIGSSAAPTWTARPRPRSPPVKRRAVGFRPKHSSSTWPRTDTARQPQAAAAVVAVAPIPFNRFERLDEQITGYLMTHGDSSARAVTRHVTGRYADVATRLRAVAVRGPDKRWRLNPEVTPVADIGGGGIPGVTDSRSDSQSDSHRTRSHPESPGASDSRSDSQPTPPTRSQWESPTTDVRARLRACPPSISAKVVVVPARRNAHMVSMFPSSQTPQTTW